MPPVFDGYYLVLIMGYGIAIINILFMIRYNKERTRRIARGLIIAGVPELMVGTFFILHYSQSEVLFATVFLICGISNFAIVKWRKPLND